MTATAETKPGIVFSTDKQTAIHTVGNGNVFTYKEYNGVYYHNETPDEVVRGLDSARRHRTRNGPTLFDPEDYDEETLARHKKAWADSTPNRARLKHPC